MTKHNFLVAMVLAFLPALALAQGPTVKAGPAWARPAGGTAAVYLTLTAEGAADRLTGASTPEAGMAMLHETSVEGGVARMRMIESLPLPAGATVSLHPGGYHIMLMELKQRLKPGDAFPLTLTFERARATTVTVHVLAPGASAPAAP